MKKFLCLSLVGVALMVQPVIGSDSYVRAVLANEPRSASSDATELIPEKVKAVIDKVRAAPAHSIKAVGATSSGADARPIQLAGVVGDFEWPAQPRDVAHAPPSPPGSNLEHWTLLPAALLLIGFIIRRRTAMW